MIHPSPSLSRWMLEVLLEPASAMRRMREEPPVLSFLVAASILLGAFSWVILSVNERAMARILADGASKEIIDQSRQDLRWEKLAHVAAAPIQIVLDATAGAIAMFTGSRIAGTSLPWRQIATAAIAAEAPQLLSRAVDLEFLWNEGPEVSLDLRPILRCSTSASALIEWDGQSIAARGAADEISPFTIWSAVLAGVGARQLSGASRKNAVAVSCAALILRAGIAAVGELASSELQRFNLF